MPVTKFPDPRDPENISPEGILAFGGDLHPESLRLAYGQGIFPWPMDGIPLAWFCPPERGILDFSRLHLSESLRRARRKSRFQLTINRDFPAVIRACASAERPDQDGTWITPEILEGYGNLHRLGNAHSVEVWDDSRLVGGVYGVEFDGVFSAESMFHRESNASKFALLHLVEFLGANAVDWIDIQVMTPHMEALGAKLISRDEFLRRLAQSHSRALRLSWPRPAPSA